MKSETIVHAKVQETILKMNEIEADKTKFPHDEGAILLTRKEAFAIARALIDSSRRCLYEAQRYHDLGRQTFYDDCIEEGKDLNNLALLAQRFVAFKEAKQTNEITVPRG